MSKSFCCSLLISLVTVLSLISNEPFPEKKVELTTWQSYSPIALWQKHQENRQLKHTGEKPSWLKLKPYRDGSYVQFNFDARDFCVAMMVKMTAQTMYAMAHTGTRIENFKTAVWRPGIARSVINWVPFAVTCVMLSSLKEKRSLLQQLETSHQTAKNEIAEPKKSE